MTSESIRNWRLKPEVKIKKNKKNHGIEADKESW